MKRQRVFYAALGAVALLSAGLVLWATRPWGLGLSPDSVSYVSAAQNVLAGEGLRLFDRTPMVAWPPWYPLTLAGLSALTDQPPLTVAPWLNAALFAGVVYLSGLFARRYLRLSRGFALGCALAVALSIPLSRVALRAWSDLLFVFWSVASFYIAERYARHPTRRWLALWTLGLALATLTRYVGVVMVVWAVARLWAVGRLPRRRKAKHAALLAFGALLPLAVWLARNWAVAGTWTGPRAPSRYTLGHNVAALFRVLIAWAIPPSLAADARFWLLVGVVVALLGAVGWAEARRQWRVWGQRAWPVALFVALYASFMVLSATHVAFDPLDDRLLAPLAVPLTWLFFGAAEKLLHPYRKRLPARALNAALAVIFLVGLRYEATTTLLNAAIIHRDGLEYGSVSWRESPTVRFVQEHPQMFAECALYSNDSDALYILTDLVAQLSPRWTSYNATVVERTLEDLVDRWPREGQACLVWFERSERPHFFSLEALRRVARLGLVARLEDGAIYTVAKRQPLPK